jgi:Domain of unknown function (DUF4402)
MRSKASVAVVAFILAAATRPAHCANVNGTAQVTVFRALSITANRTLRFGTLIRPSAGSGTAVIDTVGTGGLAVGGGVASVASSTHGNADFTVVGEGAQSVTISVDASFTMNGPSGASLTVTTTGQTTGTGVQTLGGALGGASPAVDVVVGGAITIPSAQQTGAYSGTFNVTASYN